MTLDIARRRRIGQLLDLYANLLTEHQRETLTMHVLQDWSYAEIATAQGVTRNAVYDLVHRAEAILEDYDAKVGLLAQSERRQGAREVLMDRLDGLQAELRALKRAVKEMA